MTDEEAQALIDQTRARGIEARNRSQDVADAILERQATAMRFVARLYDTLEKVYNEHGGCGCDLCQSAEMVLFDTRNQYHYPDGLHRSGLNAVYRRLLIRSKREP